MYSTMHGSGVYLMYLRKSRADLEKEAHGEFETLAKHERQLTELAGSLGLLVGGVYRELVTGESIAERTEFQAVMREVSERRCAGVIVHAIDRLGRGDPMEYGWILSTFRYTATTIVTPGKTYQPADELDFQNLQFQMFAGSWELGRIKARLREGREQAARDGEYIASHSPYGYEKCVVDRKKTLRPSGDAPVVVRMYAAAVSGDSVAAIARSLNESGIPSPTGIEWQPASVRAVIENPVYKGVVRYNHIRRQVVGRDGMDFEYGKKVCGAKDGLILARGLHPPIIDPAEWEEAVNAIAPSPRLRKELEISNPLAGLLRCKKCGRALRMKTSNHGKYQYRRVTHKPSKDCHMRSCSLPLVMRLLVEGLQEIAEDAEYDFGGDGGRAAHEAEVVAVESALAAESRMLDSLIELYSAKAITLEEFAKRREKSAGRVSSLESKLDDLRESKPKEPAAVRASVIEALAAVQDEALPAKERNDALRRIIDSVEYENQTTRQKDQRVNLTIHLR